MTTALHQTPDPTAIEAHRQVAGRSGWVARLPWWLAPAATWTVSAAYVASRIDRGWVPHDEGLIAQTAERVLLGELPHRDFVDVYTGGLAYAHAFAFRLLGVSLLSPRMLMFAVFLGWVPALYYVVARFVRPWTAAALTLLAVVWSVACYPASLPSWYNLYLATFGTAALLRYVDTRRRRWLVVAGLCGGVSMLAKVVGLFFIAGALLFFVYRERCATRAETSAAGGGRGYSVLVTAALAAFVVALVGLVVRLADTATIVHFVLPGAALATALVAGEWAPPTPDESRRRLARLAGEVVPFLSAAAVPVLLFVAWYAAHGAVGALIEGVFVLPQKRLSLARFPLPPLFLSIPFLVLLLVLAAPAYFARGREARTLAALVALIGAVVVVVSATQRFVYLGVWLAIRLLPPVLVVAGAVLLVRSGARRRRRMPEAAAASEPAESGGASDASEAGLAWQRRVLVLAVLATFTLVQFPFSSPLYFAYVAPLVVVAIAALAQLRLPAHPGIFAALVASFVLFAVLRLRPATTSGVGFVFRPAELTGRLDGPRGRLRVRQRQADETRRMVAAVTAHVPAGGYILATPDCPEVYFLSGTRNPTPTIYDSLDELDGREERILRAIDEHDVRVVVVNAKPEFAAPITTALADSFAVRFPHVESAGRFSVRWRE